MKRNKTVDYIMSVLSILMVCIFPIIFMYAQNAGESSFSECLKPTAIFCGIGLVVFALLLLLLKETNKAALVTVLCMLVFLNFALIEKGILLIFPELRYWHILGILIIIVLHVSVLLLKKLPKDIIDISVRVCCLMFGILIMINIVSAAPTIIKKVSLERELKHNNEIRMTSTVEKLNQPNIYYILFDEYSAFNSIKNVYGYDNSEFCEYLQEKNFNVSLNSYNEGFYTAKVTANIADLSYDCASVDPNDATSLDSVRKNGKLFQTIREHGYNVQSVGKYSNFFGIERVDEDKETNGAVTINGDSFDKIILDKTVFYPFTKYNLTSEQKNVLTVTDYVLNPDNIPEGNTFTLLYAVCPHAPFVFDENGGIVSVEYRLDWKGHYLGQYIYCTKLMKKMIESITECDPTAIIVLQSDHSARAINNGVTVMDISFEDKTNILNAVYFGGKDFSEIEGQSGVNTWRLLLNKMFDCEFEILEVPKAE